MENRAVMRWPRAIRDQSRGHCSGIDPEFLESRLDFTGQSGKRVSQVWTEVGNQLEKKIKSYTLEDLMPSDYGEMYYI